MTTYDADGVLQDCWAKDHTPRQNILRNSSFDLVTAKRRGRGYVSIPHVETIFEGYYPWVVSVVRRMPENSPRQWISMDIRFSALAATINNVGIGQHGYCYLMDERGNTVYHPQQQLLYAGLKKEEAGRLPAWATAPMWRIPLFIPPKRCRAAPGAWSVSATLTRPSTKASGR